jgi:hypothetical protein
VIQSSALAAFPAAIAAAGTPHWRKNVQPGVGRTQAQLFWLSSLLRRPTACKWRRFSG